MNELRQRAEKAEAERTAAMITAKAFRQEADTIEAATIERCIQAYRRWNYGTNSLSFPDVLRALKPSGGEAITIERIKPLLAKIAAVPLWRDTYPDGPDMTVQAVNYPCPYGLTADDVRLARAIVNPSGDPCGISGTQSDG